jgi:hypothetical protein
LVLLDKVFLRIGDRNRPLIAAHTSQAALGAVTPIGGLLFIAGWGQLALTASSIL